MFRNSRGYVDPTATIALGHFSYKDRQCVLVASREIQAAEKEIQHNRHGCQHHFWIRVWPKKRCDHNKISLEGDCK